MTVSLSLNYQNALQTIKSLSDAPSNRPTLLDLATTLDQQTWSLHEYSRLFRCLYKVVNSASVTWSQRDYFDRHRPPLKDFTTMCKVKFTFKTIILCKADLRMLGQDFANEETDFEYDQIKKREFELYYSYVIGEKVDAYDPNNWKILVRLTRIFQNAKVLLPAQPKFRKPTDLVKFAGRMKFETLDLRDYQVHAGNLTIWHPSKEVVDASLLNKIKELWHLKTILMLSHQSLVDFNNFNFSRNLKVIVYPQNSWRDVFY